MPTSCLTSHDFLLTCPLVCDYVVLSRKQLTALFCSTSLFNYMIKDLYSGVCILVLINAISQYPNTDI